MRFFILFVFLMMGVPIIVSMNQNSIREFFGDPPVKQKTFTEIMGHPPFTEYKTPHWSTKKEVDK